MTEPNDRPDPDALLARVQTEEARARRAKLKIFFGFAPGVGKTYRMLQVARDLVVDQRRDIVVGLVETHRRSETASMTLGLEILPRRKVEYRGRELEELDLDAALARKPSLILVDELAHTNAPGSRHAKRWQDVLELLDAGIDVFTTVNVQHVESLNDVVAQITHVQVREIVPDSIFERADEIELVDIAPEELLTRLREGKVYLPDQARRAIDHFFERGNLLALRELALRHTAEHVDADVLEYREQHGVARTWPATERLLVCVGPAPSSDRLVRATSRMAASLRAPWSAAYVESPERINDASHQRLESHLRLAESLGGTVTRLSGDRLAPALLAYARKHNVTRIVIGKPTHSRLRDRLRGSLVNAIIRGSGDIEVHVMSGDEARNDTPRTTHTAPSAVNFGPYAIASGFVAFTTIVAALGRMIYPVPDLELLYLLAVMVTAVRYGRGPSIAAAALSVAAYDFFFVPPLFTFVVADVRYILTFAMMFGVGLLVSELTSRIRRQEQDALTREGRTAALFALSRDLGAATDPRAVAAVVAKHAAEAMTATAFVLLPLDDDRTLRVAGAWPADASLDAKELGVAKWCFEHKRPCGHGTDTLPGSKTTCAPLAAGDFVSGVLALGPQEGETLSAEQRELLDAFRRQAAFALERSRLADVARVAALRARAEEMRSSLLSAVSHDLRTPLAAITGAATSLRDDPKLSAASKAEMLDTVCEEADRLEHLVASLLDMTRLDSGAVALKRDWVPLEELVGSALTRLEGPLRDRVVRVDIPESVPLVSVDPVLFGQLFVNLFENAAKHTPPKTPIEVRAIDGDAQIIVEVRDHGPGLAEKDLERVFEKFYRGAEARGIGVGLGLPICRGIVDAHGGTIVALNAPGGGAIFRVTIPKVGTPPSITSPVDGGA